MKALIAQGASLGEGPCWHAGHQVLYWVDIDNKLLHRYNPSTGLNETFPQDERVGTVAPYGDNELILALENSLIVFNPETNDTRTICAFAAEDSNLRSNDGKCDPAGRFWIGSMPFDNEVSLGDLYRLNTDSGLQHQLSNIYCSNGLAWDLGRKRMYYIDSGKKSVFIFDYDHETGAISNQQTHIEFSGDMGVPDGMCIDDDDCIWVAQWGGFGVSRFDPDGSFMQKVDCPARCVTACTFGGADRKTLFITSAHKDGSYGEATEHDGRLYSIDLDISGPAAYHFKA